MTRDERRVRRAALVAAYAGSGLSQRAFAEQHGISAQTFYSWMGQFRRRRSPQGQGSCEAKFVEVTPSTSKVRESGDGACRLAIGPVMLWFSQTPPAEWLVEVVQECGGI
jgi:transposase-like protein